MGSEMCIRDRLKGEEEANKYIGIFSGLLRKTLDMSALQNVKLSEEIDYLKNYIILQELRLNYPINTTYLVGDELDVDLSEIPALMVQPLVENAILHGINPLKKQGELTIIFKRIKDCLVAEVIDNGIGRKACLLYTSPSPRDLSTSRMPSSA